MVARGLGVGGAVAYAHDGTRRIAGCAIPLFTHASDPLRAARGRMLAHYRRATDAIPLKGQHIRNVRKQAQRGMLGILEQGVDVIARTVPAQRPEALRHLRLLVAEAEAEWERAARPHDVATRAEAEYGRQQDDE